MEIRERHVGPTVVLDLSGPLVGGNLLKDKVNSLVFQGHRQILLNLGDVSYVDSSGLGELIASHTTVSRPGGQIKLVNLTRRVHDLLTITKLVTVFESFDVEAEALQSFPTTV
jgi:anti-sigma B factor antagonist